MQWLKGKNSQKVTWKKVFSKESHTENNTLKIFNSVGLGKVDKNLDMQLKLG